ncbi:TetR/AcrR family transcriptional regulator [Petroclostridium sp. X23]|uniref:TetR/AcrR family transcriptional regulator n=1 Tax=Petroclostridium sp. X23 TaxID=3045146 RepID=UPI0024AD80C4|nr:TetR/AcrR family transcriptional regulator [Petroclostridium sp. X23]WHH57793.1 TetR/AcrR family transcriptional regulator [Petroclostridium sp. X23]
MKRTKEDAEQTRQAILDASFEIINRKGFERMTRDDIAMEMGMTRGAVNWHFKTKEEIYFSVLQNILDRLEIMRKKYQNDYSMSAEERLTNLFLMPIRHVKWFQFVNRIPHYLLEEAEFSSIENRIYQNRIKFLGYLEGVLTEIEKKSGNTLKKPKDKVAQALYLIYEGLHTRNTWNNSMIQFSEKEIWELLSNIIY